MKKAKLIYLVDNAFEIENNAISICKEFSHEYKTLILCKNDLLCSYKALLNSYIDVISYENIKETKGKIYDLVILDSFYSIHYNLRSSCLGFVKSVPNFVVLDTKFNFEHFKYVNNLEKFGFFDIMRKLPCNTANFIWEEICDNDQELYVNLFDISTHPNIKIVDNRTKKWK